MAEPMNSSDRNILIAAHLAAAVLAPGDSAEKAVSTFRDVLTTLVVQGGATQAIREARALLPPTQKTQE